MATIGSIAVSGLDNNDPNNGFASGSTGGTAATSSSGRSAQTTPSFAQSVPPAAFEYSAQPRDASEVLAAWSAFLDEGKALPRWRAAIDDTWVPDGARQVQLTDSLTGDAYYTLAPQEVSFAYSPMPENRYQVWVAGLNYKADPVLHPLPLWEKPIQDSWVPEGFTQESMREDATGARYYTLVSTPGVATPQTITVGDESSLLQCVAAIQSAHERYYAFLVQLEAEYSSKSGVDLDNPGEKTIVIDGAALGDTFLTLPGTTTSYLFRLSGTGRFGFANLNLGAGVDVGSTPCDFGNVKFHLQDGAGIGIATAQGADVTVTNCEFLGIYPSTNYPGPPVTGISLEADSTLTATGSYFRTTAVAGILSKSGCTVTVADSEFSGNTSGACIQGSGTYTITNCLFQDNDIANASNSSGAAILAESDSRFTITGSSFINNRGGVNGGAVAVNDQENVALSFTQCYFEGNSIGGNSQRSRGGAISFADNNNCTLSIDACLFRGNGITSANNTTDGGAIAVFGGHDMAASVSITNTTFENNYTGDDGGALFFESRDYLITATVTNCTFVGNEGRGGYGNDSGGAVQVSQECDITFVHNTFYANTKGDGAGMGGAIGFTSSGSSGLPRVTLQNNLFIENAASPAGSGSANVDLISKGVSLVQDPGGNVGLDNGNADAFLPTAAETFFIEDGARTPRLAANDTNDWAGCDLHEDKTMAPVTTLMILSGGAAQGKGVGVPGGGLVPVCDQRGDSRGKPPSAGAVDVRSGISVLFHKNDPSGADATVMSDSIYSAGDEVALPTYAQVTDIGGEFAWAVEGHRFMGWSTTPDGAERLDSYHMPDPLNEDQHLYAVWASSFTVTFDTQGGSALLPLTEVLADSTIPEPEAPARSGFLFDGWFKEADCIHAWNFDTDTVIEDTTLYAKWTASHTVNFDPQNGAHLSPLTDVRTGSTIAPPKDPVYDGHFFDGWFQEADCVTQWDFDNDTVTSDITLYAKWTPFYTVLFDLQNDDTSIEPLTEVRSGATILEPEAPVYDGHLFDGWFKEAECETPWDFETDTVTGDTTLYAKWTPCYTVTLDFLNGEKIEYLTQVRTGATIPEPEEPAYDGHFFDGWFQEPECETPWDFETDTVTSNITLYAKWTPFYTVVFDLQNGDTSTEPLTEVRCGSTIAAPEDPVYDGHLFDGWFKEAECETPWDFETDTVTGDTTLFAKWTPCHTVTFDLQNGDNSIKPLTEVRTGSTIPEPEEPVYENHYFDGWFKEAECETPWDFETDTVTSDTTLYAKWTPFYTVIFDLQNGVNSISPLTGVRTGSTIQQPDDPAYRKHDFDGWYKEPACETPWNFKTDTVTGNVTLYAKWTPLYDVTFNTQGKQSVPSILNVRSGNTIAAPASPSYNKFDFDGWYKEAACINAWNFKTDKVTSDVTLYAKWTPLYDIYFYSQGRLLATFRSTRADVILPRPADPVRSEYRFDGWYKEAACVNAWNFSTDRASATTVLYAKWTALYTVTFEPNEGTYVAPLTGVPDGSTISAPRAPTRTFYALNGWYKDPHCTTPWNFATDKVTGPTTLYAGWTLTSPADSSSKPSSSTSRPASSMPASSLPASSFPNSANEGGDDPGPPPVESIPVQPVPAASSSDDSSVVYVTIPGTDINVPLVGRSGSYWALSDLGLTVCTVALSISMLFVRKREEVTTEAGYDEDTPAAKRTILWKVLGLVIGVFSIVYFLLTQDMRLPMAISDSWTLLSVLLIVLQVILFILNLWSSRGNDQDAWEDDGYDGTDPQET